MEKEWEWIVDMNYLLHKILNFANFKYIGRQDAESGMYHYISNFGKKFGDGVRSDILIRLTPEGQISCKVEYVDKITHNWEVTSLCASSEEEFVKQLIHCLIWIN